MIKLKQSANGTYYFVASLGFNPVTGKRIQKKRSGFKTKAAAKQAYAKILMDYSQGAYLSDSTMTFERFTEEFFLPWYKSRVKESTYDNRLMTVRKHFAYFYEMPISKISPLLLQQWQVKLMNQCSNSYARAIFGMLSLALDRAIALGLIEENPCKSVGNIKKQKSSIDFWTRKEFETVISTFCIDDYMQHFYFASIWLLFMTGLRIGEATALQWSDINLEEQNLRVSKTLYYKNMEDYSFTEPKTPASKRTLALDNETVSVLNVWKNRQRQYVKTGFVLSYNGIPTQKHTISRAITRHASLANVHRIRIHGLRHSHASLLISLGENPLVIKERLGHEDVQTTLGTYGHLYPNTNYQVAERLNGKVRISLPDSSLLKNYSCNQFTSGVTKTVTLV